MGNRRNTQWTSGVIEFTCTIAAPGETRVWWSRSRSTYIRLSPEGENMTRIFCVALLAALAGCSGMPTYAPERDPCAGGEGTYDCQVHRYHNVAM